MQCAAKAKSTGETCRRRAMKGKRVCQVHGGKSKSGTDSPAYQHGRYSKYAKTSVTNKIDEFRDLDPLSLVDELATQRGLLAEHLERFKDSPLAASDIGTLISWLNDIGRMVERMVKIRNDSALTAAEILHLQIRAADVVMKYFDDEDTQERFLRELFDIDTAGDNSADGSRRTRLIASEAR